MVALPVAENVNLLMRSPKSLKVAGIAPGINGTTLAAAETAVFVVCIVFFDFMFKNITLIYNSVLFADYFSRVILYLCVSCLYLYCLLWTCCLTAV